MCTPRVWLAPPINEPIRNPFRRGRGPCNTRGTHRRGRHVCRFISTYTTYIAGFVLPRPAQQGDQHYLDLMTLVGERLRILCTSHAADISISLSRISPCCRTLRPMHKLLHIEALEPLLCDPGRRILGVSSELIPIGDTSRCMLGCAAVQSLPRGKALMPASIGRARVARWSANGRSTDAIASPTRRLS
ncbi:hypothetical protein F4859DRAFT_244442 [Xylaria cf. heliscus]|nr:hypothetical protein F4859DRAFT_244442 [Xylaria cf. heliscus]